MHQVGMIGLGIMGSAISANLLKAGISVIGYDVLNEKIDTLVQKGGKGASSPREVVQNTDIVITLLPSVAALESVVWGKDGILSSGRKGLVAVESGRSINVTRSPVGVPSIDSVPGVLAGPNSWLQIQ